MKFQKGLLDDIKPDNVPRVDDPKPEVEGKQPARPPSAPTGAKHSPHIPADHLFETVDRSVGSSRNYIKLFAVVIVFVVIAGIAFAYLTLPSIGDAVRPPDGLDLAVRDHFLSTEKRTATEIIFYKCDGYYGARVGVETRTDIQNPLYRIGSYSADAFEHDGRWQISATPLAENDPFTPCRR